MKPSSPPSASETEKLSSFFLESKSRVRMRMALRAADGFGDGPRIVRKSLILRSLFRWLTLSFMAVHICVGAADSDRIVALISVDGLAHYYFEDPNCEMPTIRELAAKGARAKMMKCSTPTVTWPNHTTLVTGVHAGKHGVIGNSYFDREKNEVIKLIPDPFFNKDEIVKVPTIYDVAKVAGLKTAAIIWPASRGAKTLDWTVPDCFSNSLWRIHGTSSLLAEFQQAGIPYEKQEEWCRTGKDEDRDRMYVQMFNHVVRTHRPHLALLHLVRVDHAEHAKGPQSPEAYAAVKFADDRVREVWQELQNSFPGKATLIVAADHGFFNYQQSIQPNVLLRQQGLLTADDKQITGGQVRAHEQGGVCYLSMLDRANRGALTKRVVELFREVEGVHEIVLPGDFAKHGLPDPEQNPGMGDVMLLCKEGYIFSNTATGDSVVTPKSEAVRGAHGYDANEPRLHANFVAWGAGIRPGKVVERIENIDVAPTIASLLGLTIKADGKVLNELLLK